MIRLTMIILTISATAQVTVLSVKIYDAKKAEEVLPAVEIHKKKLKPNYKQEGTKLSSLDEEDKLSQNKSEPIKPNRVKKHITRSISQLDISSSNVNETKIIEDSFTPWYQDTFTDSPVGGNITTTQSRPAYDPSAFTAKEIKPRLKMCKEEEKNSGEECNPSPIFYG